MKTNLAHLALVLALPVTAFAQEKSSQAFPPTELTQRTLQRRGIEAVIWGMPAVNAELMFQAMKTASADFNQVLYWSRPINWKD